MDPRSHAVAYVYERIDFDQLQAWLSETLFGDLDALPEQERDALLTLGNMVAEFTGAHISERDLKRAIRLEFGIAPLTVVSAAGHPKPATSSASPTRVVKMSVSAQEAHG